MKNHAKIFETLNNIKELMSRPETTNTSTLVYTQLEEIPTETMLKFDELDESLKIREEFHKYVSWSEIIFLCYPYVYKLIRFADMRY